MAYYNTLEKLFVMLQSNTHLLGVIMQQAINQLLGFKVLYLNTLLLGFTRQQSNFQQQKFTVQQLSTQRLGFMVCWLNTHLWCCRQITSCSTGSAAVLPIITILTFTTPEKNFYISNGKSNKIQIKKNLLYRQTINLDDKFGMSVTQLKISLNPQIAIFLSQLLS